MSDEELRPEDRLILYFTRFMSLFHHRLIHPPAHKATPSLGIGFTMYVCANTPDCRLSRFPRKRIHHLESFYPQSTLNLNPCDVILCTNDYYQLIYVLYA